MKLPAITVSLTAVMAFGVSIAAQGDLERKLEKKLKGDWVTNASWTTDFAKAKQTARKTGKQIFAYFTRS